MRHSFEVWTHHVSKSQDLRVLFEVSEIKSKVKKLKEWSDHLAVRSNESTVVKERDEKKKLLRVPMIKEDKIEWISVPKIVEEKYREMFAAAGQAEIYEFLVDVSNEYSDNEAEEESESSSGSESEEESVPRPQKSKKKNAAVSEAEVWDLPISLPEMMANLTTSEQDDDENTVQDQEHLFTSASLIGNLLHQKPKERKEGPLVSLTAEDIAKTQNKTTTVQVHLFLHTF